MAFASSRPNVERWIPTQSGPPITAAAIASQVNQEIVTGLGNIYADETLFESKIQPMRQTSSIRKNEIKLLHTAIIRIIKRAIKVGGSSVATYKLLDESTGNYAREHKVYGKFGEKCPRCSKPLEKTEIQTRTTIFCSNCQK